jgi:hypothetical protein
MATERVLVRVAGRTIHINAESRYCGTATRCWGGNTELSVVIIAGYELDGEWNLDARNPTEVEIPDGHPLAEAFRKVFRLERIQERMEAGDFWAHHNIATNKPSLGDIGRWAPEVLAEAKADCEADPLCQEVLKIRQRRVKK